jgi:branched-chain amino acid transport system permease protein
MEIVPLIVGGIANGGLYALVALGLALVYKTQGFANFGHGELYMAGGFIGFTAYDAFHLPYVGAFLCAVFGAALIGVIVERLVVRPVVLAPHASLVMVTVGLSEFMRGLARLPWGDDVRTFPPVLDYDLTLGDVVISSQYLIIVLTVLVLTIVASLFFRFSLLGKRMRATAEKPAGAKHVGINTGKVYAITWALAAGVGGLAGILAAPMTFLAPDMGLPMLLKGFAACVLGGFGSIPGAIVGGFALGLVEMLAGGYVSSSLLDISGFIVIMVVLIARPQGLFGSTVRQRV